MHHGALQCHLIDGRFTTSTRTDTKRVTLYGGRVVAEAWFPLRIRHSNSAIAVMERRFRPAFATGQRSPYEEPFTPPARGTSIRREASVAN